MPIDLTGQSFNVAQSIIDQGQSLDMTFSVLNDGDEAVDPFSFDIVLSKDGVIDENDLVIGNYVIPEGLEAGESSGVRGYRYKTPPRTSSFWSDKDATYTVGLRLDPNSNVFESNEENNSNLGLNIDRDLIEVKDFKSLFKDQRAELKGQFIDVANKQITPGEKIDLRFIVENESPAMANPFSIDVYLSPTQDTGVEGAVKIGTYDIRTGIEGNGDTGIKRYLYNTPDIGDPIWEKGDGEYFIAFDIDSKKEVDETREGNNSGQGEGLDYTKFDVTGINTAADLVVTNFKAPENAKAGDTVTVEYEIVNQGKTAADLFGAGLYLFNKEYLAGNESLNIEDAPDKVFFSGGSRTSSLLSVEPGGSTGILTDEITLPESWGGYSGNGDYYLGVEADPYDDVVESNDANNSLTEEMVDYQTISLKAPNNNTVDLAGTNFKVVQDQIVPGQEIDLDFTVKNKGMAAADPFYIDMYLSQDANIDPEEDFRLGTYNIKNGLDGQNDSGPKSVSYIAPEVENSFWGDEDGTYYAGMVIDPADRIIESDESNNSNSANNVDYASTRVTGLEEIADLETSSFNVTPKTIDTGSTFEVSYEITNAGTASADMFSAGFFIFNKDYLMNHDALDVKDAPKAYFLAGNRSDGLISLEAGESTGTMTTELVMPQDWGGFATGSDDYYIGFAADPYGEVAESNEMNNSLLGMDVDYQEVSVNVAATDI